MKIFDQIRTGTTGITNALASLLTKMKAGLSGQDLAASFKPVVEAYLALNASQWVLPSGDSELSALHAEAINETKEAFDFYKKLLTKTERQRSGSSSDRILFESLGRAIAAWNRLKTVSEARAAYYANVG